MPGNENRSSIGALLRPNLWCWAVTAVAALIAGAISLLDHGYHQVDRRIAPELLPVERWCEYVLMATPLLLAALLAFRSHRRTRGRSLGFHVAYIGLSLFLQLAVVALIVGALFSINFRLWERAWSGVRADSPDQRTIAYLYYSRGGGARYYVYLRRAGALATEREPTRDQLIRDRSPQPQPPRLRWTADSRAVEVVTDETDRPLGRVAGLGSDESHRRE